MNKKSKSINILIAVSYIILIVSVIYIITSLPQKYNREEIKLIQKIEDNIREVLEYKNDESIKVGIESLREDYRFDIVIARDDEVIYKSVPYVAGEALVSRVHADAVAKESQGYFTETGDDLFIWYSIYRLNDSEFINSFLWVLFLVVIIVSLLVILSVYVMTNTLMKPLRNIKESIKHAKNYEFDEVSDESDAVNQSFKEFVSDLDDSISAVSRQHTELEKKLQASHQHLNNVMIVSKSMVHDLKTPLHRVIMINENTIKNTTNKEIYNITKENNLIIDTVMDEINTILRMLNNTGGDLEIEKTEVDLVSILTKTISQFYLFMNQKELMINFDGPDSLNVLIEESTLILLMNNLLSNMINYALKESELCISLNRYRDFIEITFINESTEENINRMKKSENLFSSIQHNEDYAYSSGNGLYLIKELTQMLRGKYFLRTEENKVIINVRLPYE